MKSQLVHSLWKQIDTTFGCSARNWLILTTPFGWQIEAMSMKENSDRTAWKQEMRESHGCLDLEIKVLGGFQIMSSLATSLLYSFNRSYGKTFWKINTSTPDASEGRPSNLHKYQLCSLGKLRYRWKQRKHGLLAAVINYCKIMLRWSLISIVFWVNAPRAGFWKH